MNPFDALLPTAGSKSDTVTLRVGTAAAGGVLLAGDTDPVPVAVTIGSPGIGDKVLVAQQGRRVYVIAQPEPLPVDVSTAWAAPTLLNSWVTSGGAKPTVGYRRDATGRVWLRGTVKSGTVNTIMTLPVGFRPVGEQTFVCRANAGLARVDVTASGDVDLKAYISSGTNADVALDGCSWEAAP